MEANTIRAAHSVPAGSITLLRDPSANFCRCKLPRGQPYPEWGEMNRSDVIVEQINPVLGYVDTPLMSVLHALEFFEYFREGRLVVLELGS